jgi:hypothetical protein
VLADRPATAGGAACAHSLPLGGLLQETDMKMKMLLASISIGVALGASAVVAGAQVRAAAPPASSCDRSGVDRVACLQDERSARVEQRRNGLVTPDAETMARNQRARCERLPADDRQACLRRMAGEGTQSGSVEQGGLLRELTVVETPPAAPAAAQPPR